MFKMFIHQQQFITYFMKNSAGRASVSVAKESELFNVNDNADENNLFLLRYRYPVIIS